VSRKRHHDDGVWKFSYGTRPYVVFAMERRDRGGQVFVRWNNPNKPGVEKRDRKGLGLVVRDPKTGRLDAKLVRAAQLAIQQFQATILVTGPPPPPDGDVQPNTTRPATPAAESTPDLTIKAGFDLALDPERGKYGSNRTRRYDQMLKYRERLFGGARHAVALLDAQLTWAAFVPGEARALWRRMADRHLSSKGEEFGVRAAEGVVDAIYSVAAWLREEHFLPVDVAQPPAQWRKALREEWGQRTGKRRMRPSRPRHTAAEYRGIFATISDPRVDPRIRLAIELAAECRTGQVLRCTRGMLALPDVAPEDYESAAPGSLGQIEIHGAGKKHGEVVVLTPEQRRAVDDALAGYLANYEAAWRAGQIDDYYLFPGSKMRMLDANGRRWTRKLRTGVKPLSRDGARVAFKELEAIAKVDHVEGRGWYGLRRIAADLAESATTDDRVKDRLGGWQDSETRKQIYQDRQTDELRTEAAKVRRELRLGGKIEVNGTEASVDLDALLATLTPEQHALLAAKINAPTGPGTGPKKKTPGPIRIPATASDWNYKTSKERAMGLEPTTSSLGSWHSTN
jgi:hypothetical protein